MSDNELTYEQFAESLNTTYRLLLDESRVFEIKLAEVSARRGSRRQERFSLIFKGSLDLFLPQNSYRAEHDRLGAFDLFLVPVEKEEDAFLYEAFFNRLLKTDEAS